MPMKTEKTECSETSAYKIQTPGNYPEENIYHQTINLKTDVVSDMTLYVIVTDHQRFGGTCRYLQCYRRQQSS